MQNTFVDLAAAEAWYAAIETEMRDGRCSRSEATQRVARNRPDLREQFVAVFNAMSPDERQRLQQRYR